MPVITFRDVIHKGKSLFNCLVKRDMSLEQVLEIYANAIIALQKDANLDSVRLKELGIESSCSITSKNLLTAIINALIEADHDIEKNMGLIQKTVTQIQQASTTNSDEKVKVNKDDAAPGFLAEKIKSKQPGTLVVESNTLFLVGFVPMGACFFIGRDRLPDFDATGKGKPGTDVWGYAFSNGENGTTNRFGAGSPRYVSADQVNDAGKKGGKDSFTIGPENIKSMDLTVAGTIENALATPFKVDFKFNKNRMKDGSGGDTWLLRLGSGSDGSDTMSSLPMTGFEHSHQFNLKAKHTNPNVTAIALVPEHMLEIPIQRIHV